MDAMIKKLLRLEYKNLIVSSCIDGKIHIRYEACCIKDGIMGRYAYGSGDTVEEAAQDYYNQISGKTLLFDALSNPKEVIVL